MHSVRSSDFPHNNSATICFKKCPHCGNVKPLSEFHKNPTSKNKDRIRSNCKECQNKRRVQQRYYLKSKYGMTIEEFNAMYAACEGKCKICSVEMNRDNQTQKGAKADRCVVDHCHESGQVRGLLCSNCNLLLGYVKDNTTTLLNAIKYLEERK